MILSLLLSGCETTECALPGYDRPECRVLAAQQMAQLTTSGGTALRFVNASDPTTDEWPPPGLIRQNESGVEVRLAHPGAFALSIEGEPRPGETLTLQIQNIDPRLDPLPHEVARQGISRTLEVPLDEPVRIVGGWPTNQCNERFRIAAFGDVQTNPFQLERIIDALHIEASEGATAGEPLLAALLLGDLAEDSLITEFETVDEILRGSPVPVVVVPGNHDVYNSNQAVYNQVFGPGNHAFDLCDARFVLVDTGTGFIANSVQGRLPTLIGEGWDHMVFGAHHPPYAAQTSFGWTREDQAQQVLAQLASQGTDLLLAGHLHMRHEKPNAIIPEVIVGTAGADQFGVEPDYGYLRVTFGDNVDYCFVEVPAPGSDGTSLSSIPTNCG